MKQETKPYCCQIDCKADAVYQIIGPGGFEDYTHSCEEHLPEMKMHGDEYFRLSDVPKGCELI